MSYYDYLKSVNLVRLVSKFLKNGTLSLRGTDNKFVANLQVQWDTPWCHAKSDIRINCFLWKDVMFHGIVEQVLPKERQFVPAACQDCFKVVVRMKTLKQLFALEKLQKRLDHPSKCGIEVRQSVFGNYGGYFYNRGLEEGLDCYKRVKRELDLDPDLKENTVCLLKRGCTEYEMSIGPSDKWKISKEQIEFEMQFYEYFVNDIPMLTQSEHVKNSVRQRWIERAYDIGDETVLEFNDGKPLYPAYVTYHHLSANEEPQTEE